MAGVTFIDGPQGVGKTTLINYLRDMGWAEIHKFPFADYSKRFNLQSGEALRGFRLGKELSSLFYLTEFPPSARSTRILIDRGPMSTAYYMKKTGSLFNPELKDFLSILASYQKNGAFTYIFITAKNFETLNERNKKDGFDAVGLGQGPECLQSLEELKEEAEEVGFKFVHFENDFSKSIKDNAWDLMAAISNSWGIYGG